jgi:hypothetical protein
MRKCIKLNNHQLDPIISERLRQLHHACWGKQACKCCIHVLLLCINWHLGLARLANSTVHADDLFGPIAEV